MANNTRNSLIALGLAGLAFWKWGMKQEDKDRLKQNINDYSKKALDKVPADMKNKLGLNKTEEIHLD